LVAASRPRYVRENIAFVLGHALYMKAIHGGKAKNDKIDAHKIAVLLRGGMIPMAYVYPREMRSTRDLLRRRCRFSRQRAALLAHIQNTTSQYNLAALPKRISYKANRSAVPDHFADPEVRKSIQADLCLIEHYDELLKDLELHLVRTAKTREVIRVTLQLVTTVLTASTLNVSSAVFTLERIRSFAPILLDVFHLMGQKGRNLIDGLVPVAAIEEDHATVGRHSVRTGQWTPPNLDPVELALG
jgi:hypothetical protein